MGDEERKLAQCQVQHHRFFNLNEEYTKEDEQNESEDDEEPEH